MSVKDLVVIGILFIALGALLYLLFLEVSAESVIYQEFVTNATLSPPSQSVQFYPNMRFTDRTIKYWIEGECDEAHRQNIFGALTLLSDKTVLEFSRSSIRQGIIFLCTDIAPEPEQKTHFVAGEGGPTEILNTSLYYVILEGKVALYRPERCDEPKVALHEILHALGFDHNNNQRSIMYPITDCNQEIDQYLIDTINQVYASEPYADLVIERVSANQTGRYLSFEIITANYGLADVKNVSLSVYSGEKQIKQYSLEEMDIGRRKSLTVQNLRLFSESESLRFAIESADPIPELSTTNNYALITPQIG